MNAIMALGALLVAALGGFFFQTKKKQTAEALLSNQKAKEGLNQVDQDLAKNNGLIEAEEQKRKDMEHAQATTQELLDFLNKPKP